MNSETTSIELGEQLTQEYQMLSEMWGDLKNDLSDEEWLIIENEALIQLENSLG